MKSLNNLILVIPLIFMLSCSDTTFEVNEVNNRLNEESSTSGVCNIDIDEENTANPFDWYGSDHNDALDYVATEMSTITSAGDEMFFHIRDYLETIYTSTEVQAHLDTIDMSYIEGLTLMDTTDYANGMTWAAFRDKYGPSSPSDRYSFLTVLHKLCESSNNPQEVVDTLIHYESLVTSSPTFSSAVEKQIQLGTISVLRHSIKYWIEATENTCHPYYDYVNGEEQYSPENELATLRLDIFQLAIDAMQFMLQIDAGIEVPPGMDPTKVMNAYVRRSLIGSIYASARVYDPNFPSP